MKKHVVALATIFLLTSCSSSNAAKGKTNVTVASSSTTSSTTSSTSTSTTITSRTTTTVPTITASPTTVTTITAPPATEPPATEPPATHAPTPTPITETIISNHQRAIINIESRICTGMAGVGTGFAIDSHRILTNRHVVEAGIVDQISTSSGMGLTVENIIVSPTWKNDMAVITVRETLPYALVLANRDPRIGEQINVLGYTDYSGIVRNHSGAVVEFADVIMFNIITTLVHSSVYAPQGMSGGPVIGSDGTVVSVNRGFLRNQMMRYIIFITLTSGLSIANKGNGSYIY